MNLALKIGDSCGHRAPDKNDFCPGPYTTCSFGTCECIQGYKLGPTGDECIPDSQMYRYGESCVANAECFFNLVCQSNICQCPTGYILSAKGDCKISMLLKLPNIELITYFFLFRRNCRTMSTGH